MIELRRRRVAKYGPQRARAERLARNKARPHQGPGVVDETRAQPRDEGAEAKLTEDERCEDPGRNRKGARRRLRPRPFARSGPSSPSTSRQSAQAQAGLLRRPPAGRARL